MATSTFTGPLRSESTLKTISKNSSTGAITEIVTLGDGPVSLSDGNVTLTNATHSGRVLLVITPGNTNFYIGGVTFLDTDGDAISSVFSNGSSNSSIQFNVPAGFDVTIVGLNTTNYQIFGNVTSTTAPAFADQ